MSRGGHPRPGSELVAVGPDGSVLWRTSLDPSGTTSVLALTPDFVVCQNHFYEDDGGPIVLDRLTAQVLGSLTWDSAITPRAVARDVIYAVDRHASLIAYTSACDVAWRLASPDGSVDHGRNHVGAIGDRIHFVARDEISCLAEPS